MGCQLPQSIQLLCVLHVGLQDDENRDLSSQLKEAEEERGRLQRTASSQQTQLEKYKMLFEEASRKSEGLQQQLCGLEKVTNHPFWVSWLSFQTAIVFCLNCIGRLQNMEAEYPTFQHLT